MPLNQTQRTIIMVGIAVIALMGLFPPWTHTLSYGPAYTEEPAGYAFITSPIETKYDFDAFCGIKIDSTRLLIQWAVAIGVAGCLVLLTAKKE